MNEVLKDKLRVLAEDELMLKALEEVIAERIEKNKPDIDTQNDNNILGEKYRANIEAEKLIEGALEDISSYKIQRSSNKITNKGK